MASVCYDEGMTSEKPNSTRKPPITDSPWFWGYVFAAAGLAALILASQKYPARQTQLERRFLARQEGGQTIKGDNGQSIETPTGDNLILRLGPLFVIVSALLVVAWSRFWWTRLSPNSNRNALASDPSGEPSAVNSLPATEPESPPQIKHPE